MLAMVLVLLAPRGLMADEVEDFIWDPASETERISLALEIEAGIASEGLQLVWDHSGDIADILEDSGFDKAAAPFVILDGIKTTWELSEAVLQTFQIIHGAIQAANFKYWEVNGFRLTTNAVYAVINGENRLVGVNLIVIGYNNDPRSITNATATLPDVATVTKPGTTIQSRPLPVLMIRDLKSYYQQTDIPLPTQIGTLILGDRISIINRGALDIPALTNITAASTHFSSQDGVLFNNGKTVLVRFPEGLGGSYVVPSTVTNIAADAFKNCSKLTSLVIGPNVVRIGDNAFANSGLHFVYFGGNAPAISGTAFSGTSCTVYYLTGFSGWGDRGAPVSFGGTTANLYNPFSYSAVSGGLAITGGSWNNPASEPVLIPSIINGTPVVSIAAEAFDFQTGLANIVVPNTVTSIGDRAFQMCVDLKSIQLSTTLTNLGDSAFERCQSLVRLSVPNGVTVIPDGFAATCSNLTTVIIGTNVTSIGYGAFNGCEKLFHLNFPATLSSIGETALHYCGKLRVTVSPSNPYFSNDRGGALFNKTQTRLLHGNSQGGGSYSVPGTVVEIDVAAFYGAKLSAVLVPATVRSLGANAFENCEDLLGVYFAGTPPQTPTLSSALAFKGSSNAVVYRLPETTGWTSTYGGAEVRDWLPYDYATNNGSITLIAYSGPGGNVVLPGSLDGKAVTSIQAGFFSNPGAISSLVLPNSLTDIPNDAFSGLFNLTNLVIGNNITNIGDNAFEGCSSLPTLVIPNSVRNIGSGAFSQCGITNVVIGSGLTNLSDNLFFSCKLQTVSIPPTVVHIGASTFAGNPLQYVVIAASVTSLGTNAFANCKFLARAYFQGNAPATDGTAFHESGTFDPVYFSFQKTVAQYLPGTTGWGSEYSGAVAQVLPVSYSTANGAITINRIDVAGNFPIFSSINGVPVTGIGDYAFANCQALTGVIIPAGITTIGAAPFMNCPQLTTVVVAPGNPSYASVNNVLFNSSRTALIQYPAGLGGNYQIPSTVTTIGAGAFYGSGVKQVVIPAGVTEIGSEAFAYCRSLSGLTVEAGNTTYVSSGGVLFNAGQSVLLQFPGGLGGNYIVPSSVTTIGPSAFAGSGVAAVRIPSSVSVIASGAMAYCQKMTNISVLEGNANFASVNGVLQNAAGNSILQYPAGLIPPTGDFRISPNITSVGNLAFAGAFAGPFFSSVTVPVTVSSLGNSAFAGCAKLIAANFFGHAPANDGTAFTNSPSVTVHWVFGASGWGKQYGGARTHEIPFSIQNNGNNTWTVTGYDGLAPSMLVVPDNIFGETVSAIGNSAFASQTNITTLGIPTTVTSIGQHAFAGCNRLSSLVFRNSGSLSLGLSAFEGCVSLKSVAFGAGPTTLGHQAFIGCSALTDISFGGVTSIGDHAFFNCTALDYVFIGDSVVSIGAYAFADLYLSQILLPASVESLGSHAFAITKISPGDANVYAYGNPPAGDGTAFANGASHIFYSPGTTWGATYGGISTLEFPSLFDFTIGPGGATITGIISGFNDLVIPPLVFGPGSINPVPVIAIGNNAFSGNLAITNVSFPASLVSIGNAAFQNCANLLSAPLPANLQSIGTSAFQNCSNLRGITVPQTVTNIGAYAFAGCPGETNLNFGAGLAYLGGNAFSGWTNLQTVYFNGNAPADNGSAFTGAANALLYVLPGSSGWETTYFGTPVEQWIQYYYTLYTNGVPIGQNNQSILYGPDSPVPSANSSGSTNVSVILKGYSGNQSVVTVPSNIKGWPVTTLSSVFYDRRNIHSVILPNSVTEIGSDTFKYCSLTNIVFSTNLASIGSGAFQGCALQSVILPDSLTHLEDSVFSQSALTNVVFPEHLLSIGDHAFYQCPLRSVALPQTLQTIGNFAFANDLFDGNGLTNVVFPSSLTSIGNRAFYGCPMPDSILIPRGVTFIGGGAFAPVINRITGGLGGAIYFEGNAPVTNPDWGAPFEGVNNSVTMNGVKFNVGPGIAYYDPTTYGWGEDYHGLKTVPWNPYSYRIDGNSITITGYRGSGGAIRLPVTLGGYFVTAIADYAFASNSSITHVSVPETVTFVGTGAFSGSTNLAAVYFNGTPPNSGSNLFAGSNVQVFYLDSATGWGEEFGGVAVTPYPATGAITVNINPNNIGAEWQVDGGPFYTSGTTIAGVTAGVHVLSFSTASGGWQAPNSQTVFVHPFKGTLFTASYELIPFNYVTNGDGTLTITGYTGSGGNIRIPAAINGAVVTGIAANAFANSSITGVVMPDTITSVGTNAFSGCQNLLSAILSSGITNLSGNVFLNCSNLVSVFFNGNAPETDGTAFTGAINAVIYYLTASTGWTSNYGGRSAEVIPYTFEATDKVWITGYTGPGGNVEIPPTIAGLPVTYIAADAFEGNLTLTNISIPDSVVSIDWQAFSGCSNLQTVALGTNVQWIGLFAFADCTSLTSINFPETLQEINRGAFRYCGNLTNINFGDELLRIDEDAFESCTNLSQVTFGNSLTNIGQGAFSRCRSLTNLTFPDSLISIQQSAFGSCTNLVELNFNANLEFIESSAFSGCSSLTNLVLPPKVYLGSLAFAFCPRLETVLFTGTSSLLFNPTITSPFFNNSSTVVYYPTEAAELRGAWLSPDITTTDYKAAVAYSFEGGTEPSVRIDHHAGMSGADFSVPSIVAGYPVTSVASNAFSSYIDVLDIGAGILSIGTMPNMNFGVNTINVDAGNPNYTVIGGVLFDKSQTTLVRIPTFLHSSGSYTIPETVTSIADYAFAGSRVAHLTLSSNLVSIGEGAFLEANLVSISNPAPDLLTYLGESAFEGCSSLTNFVTGNNLASIQPWTFANCTQLVSVSLGHAVGSIETGAFSNCVNLASIEFPSALGSIADGAFANCQSLVTLALPAGVPIGTNYYSLQLGSGVFSGATALTSAYFLGNRPDPDYGNAFEGADLATIYFPQDSLGWSTAFGGRPATSYTPFGSLQVTFSPGLAGQQWQVDGGAWITNNSAAGETVSNLSVGSHTISFSAVNGYYTPSDQVVIVSNLTHSTLTVNYVRTPVFYTDNGNSITVSGVYQLDADGFLVIPETINGLPVTSIGDSAFANNQSLVGVIMPSTVTNIGNTSFFNCTNLRHLIFSTNLLSIGQSAFFSCKSLQAVQIPDSVTSLAPGAFTGCLNLSSVQFGTGITTVSYDTFTSCPALANLFFVGNAPSDASSLTAYYPQIQKLYYLTETAGWDGVTSGNPTDWASLFRYNINDGGGITITQRPQSFWYGSVIVPPRINGLPVTEIGDFGLQYVGQNYVLLPSTVVSFGVKAFDSSSLQEMFIHPTVTNISSGAFSSCWNLSKLFVDPANPVYSAAIGILYNKDQTELIAAGGGWKQNNSDSSVLSVPNGVVKIGDYALFGLSYVSRINLPSTLATVGEQAFSGSSYLTNITVDPLNASFRADISALFNKASTVLVQYFGASERYFIPPTIQFIGSGAFYGNWSLSSVAIPPSVVSIGDYAFLATGLKTMVVPDSVTNIGAGAFAYSSSITNLVLPAGLTTISSNLCISCQGLTSIVIPPAVTSIGASAFAYSRVNEVAIPDQVTDIGAEAFTSSMNLASVTLGDSVTNIGVGAFSYNSSLRTVNFNDNLVSISANAFYNCQWLSELVFPATLATLGDNSFGGVWVNPLFLGNAPAIEGLPFNSGTIYYYSITDGWDSTFSGRPTVAYESQFYYGENGDGTVSITGSDVSYGDLRLPSEDNGRLVTGIASSAFGWNTYNSIFIPAGITNIAPDALASVFTTTYIVDGANPAYTVVNGSLYDSTLTTLLAPADRLSFHLPSTVTNIGPTSFDNTSELMAITVDPEHPLFTAIDGILYDKQTNVLLRFPPGALENSSYSIPNFVSTIGSNAFTGTGVRAIRVPASVTNIQAHGMAFNYALRGIYFEGAAPQIDATAFEETPNAIVFYLPPATEEPFLQAGATVQPWLSLFTYQVIDGASVTIVAYNDPGNENYLHFPDTIEGLPITDVGTAFAGSGSSSGGEDSSFSEESPGSMFEFPSEGGSSLSGIKLPHGLTNIVDEAFSYAGLREVILPTNLKWIGSAAFTGNNLETINIPSNVQYIGDAAFAQNQLTNLVLPSNLQILGNEAFAQNELSGVYFNSGLLSIGEYAFTENQLNTIFIPGSVTNIGAGAFKYNNLTSLGLPASVTIIPFEAFAENSLQSIVLPAGLLNIDDYAFSYNDLENIVIPSGVTNIGMYAFGDNSISLLALPDTLASIGEGAFIYSSLETLVIPAAVASIGNSAFAYNWIGAAYFLGNAPADDDGTALEGNDDPTAWYLEGTTGWGTAYGGVTAQMLSQPAFVVNNGNNTLTLTSYLGEGSVILPSTVDGLPVTVIGSGAFAAAGSSINSITLPDGITAISREAFRDCPFLTTIVIPATVTHIDTGAFVGCPALTNIIVAEDNSYFSSIDGVLFDKTHTTLLASGAGISGTYVVPSLVTAIGAEAFMGASGLTGIVLPDGLASIGEFAFAYCDNLTALIIPSSVNSLGSYSFAACLSLTTVYFEGDAPSDDGTAFSGDINTTVYYRPSAVGFGSIFGGILAEVLRSPVAAPVIVYRVFDTAVEISIASLAGHWTDPNNAYPVTLRAVGNTSTNRAPVINNSGTILYTNANNVKDQIIYRIVNSQEQVGLGVINIVPVGIAPQIINQPLPKNVRAGLPVKFSAGVTGTSPLFRQWFFNGNPLPGATNATLVVQNVQANNAGAYSVVVTNEFGMATSSNAVLSVVDGPPRIILQPLSRTVADGANVIFSVNTIGTDPRTYQWLFEGEPILLATNKSYMVVRAQTAHEGSYHVVVSNSFGSTISSNAQLTVSNSAPTILVHPTGRSINAGLIAKFTVKAAGTGPLTYQWSLNGTPIPNATKASYSRANIQQTDAGNYSVLVSNSVGWVSSSNAFLTVVDVAPTITLQPLSRTNYASTTASFLVKARGSLPFSYQWLWQGAPILNATNATYSRKNVRSPDEGGYSVIIANDFGSATSSVAHLTVDNTFVPLAGNYNGLFYETNSVEHHSSGFINMILSEAGKMSGKLLLEGRTNKFSGGFDANGSVTLTVLRSNATSLAITLQLDLTNQTGELRGTISNGVWIADLLADRAVFNLTNNTPLAGLYTMALPGGTNDTAPWGHSYGLITLNSNGLAKVSGATADGAALQQSIPISANGDWPFYISLYGGKGSLLGWLHVHESPVRHITGTVSWVKTAGAEDYYASGFTNVTEVVGSGYTPPATGVRALDLTNAWVILEAGNLPDPSTNAITWTHKNTLTVMTPNPMLMKLSVKTVNGLLSGSFVHPVTGDTNLIKGVLLQESQQAAGYFKGANESGRVLITP